MKPDTMHPFVSKQVRERWETWYPANPLRKLLMYFRNKYPLCAINIFECENIDMDEFKHKGSIFNVWRYDKDGLRYIANSNEQYDFSDERNEEEIVDYAIEESCFYYVSKKEKKATILWSYFLVNFKSGNLNSYKVATEYSVLTNESGEDSFVLKRTNKSIPKTCYAIS